MKNKIIKYYKENGIFKTTKWLASTSLKKLKQKWNVYKSINNKIGNDKKALQTRKNKRVFIFACVPYFDVGGGQRSSQLSKSFKKLGYDILYIYGLPTNESKNYKLDYPTIMHKYIKKTSIAEIKNLLNKEDIVIFEMPLKSFLPYLELSNEVGAKVVYENIDNWESTLGDKTFDRETLKEFLIKSNLLTATAKPLKEQLESYLEEYKIENKKIIYSANAVDDSLFDSNKEYNKPSDLKEGKLTFLYYGSLWGTWFDWNLIKSLAYLDKEYQINLIGDDSMITNIKKEMPENVHFLGLKKQVELPSYLKYTDFSVLPFKKDNIGEYVSPLKIFEYISMNTRVLTTPLKDIEGYPNTYYGTKIEEWEKIINENPKIDLKKKEEFISKNNWDFRCKEILEELRSK